MNIGMILDQSFPPDPRVENEALTLTKNGHNVALFALTFGNNLARENIEGIEVFRYKMSRKLYNKLSPLAYTFSFYHNYLSKKIANFVESNSFDVLHIHDMVIADLIFNLNKKWKLPIVLDLHENRPEIMKAYSHVNSGFGKYLIDLKKWSEKQNQFILKADKVVVVTEEAKNDIINSTNKNENSIYIVPNSVLLDVFLNYSINQNIVDRYRDNFVVFYAGSTGKRRGTNTAIKAISLLVNKIKNIKLVLVGNSRDDNYLKELAAKLNISEKVDFEGWQDLKLFPSYITASDICVSPLVRNKHHDTTFANKQFQYMALGKPIVVSDCTAQANVVKETNCGLIHKASVPEDLAEKILTIYNNKELRKKFGVNAEQAVKNKYNWVKTSKELIKLYENIGNSRQRLNQ